MHAMRLTVLMCAFLTFSTPTRADDLVTCARSKNTDEAIASCTRLINSGKFKGRDLAGIYFLRMARWQAKGDQDKSLADWSEVNNHDPKFTDTPRPFEIDAFRHCYNALSPQAL